MRKVLLICSLGLLLVGPAGAGTLSWNECWDMAGPGKRSRFERSGTILKRSLTTESGIYPCAEQVKTTQRPPIPGERTIWHQICGPFVIIKTSTYRPCTAEEAQGLNPGEHSPKELAKALNDLIMNTKGTCAKGEGIPEPARYMLKDKHGATLRLEKAELHPGESWDIQCSEVKKTETVKTKYRVGDGENHVIYTQIEEFGLNQRVLPSH